MLERFEIYIHRDPEGKFFAAWNIVKAQVLATDPEQEATLYTLNREEMRNWLKGSEDGIEEDHLENVNPILPGIIAQKRVEEHDKVEAFLIDGNHRMVKAFREGADKFLCLVLTEEQSTECEITEEKCELIFGKEFMKEQ